MEQVKEQYPKVYLYRRIVQAKLFIDSRYSEYIDLDAIADEAFFSKFHFIRLFQKVYGKTPHQYLTAVRIEKVKDILKEGKMNVSDACFAVGFRSISSFTGLFKRLVGVTPAVYQVQQQQRKTEIEEAPLDFVPGCYAEKAGWKQNSNFREVL
jgi:AraC-like DNA-binding protein